jgi:hypothetical protein
VTGEFFFLFFCFFGSSHFLLILSFVHAIVLHFFHWVIPEFFSCKKGSNVGRREDESD